MTPEWLVSAYHFNFRKRQSAIQAYSYGSSSCREINCLRRCWCVAIGPRPDHIVIVIQNGNGVIGKPGNTAVVLPVMNNDLIDITSLRKPNLPPGVFLA